MTITEYNALFGNATEVLQKTDEEPRFIEPRQDQADDGLNQRDLVRKEKFAKIGLSDRKREAKVLGDGKYEESHVQPKELHRNERNSKRG